MDTTQFSAIDQVRWVILGLILSAFAIGLGRRLGFFVRVESGTTKPYPTVLQTLILFTLFLGCQLIARKSFPSSLFPSMRWMTVWVVLLVFVLLGGFLLSTWGQVRYLFSTKRWGLDLLIGIAGWLISLPAVLVVTHLSTLILSLFVKPIPIEQVAVQELQSAINTPSLFAALIGVVVIGAPLIEETLFRGFMQTPLVRILGEGWGIFITSVVFTFFHFSPEQGVSNVEILSSLFVLSCFLGYVRHRQGNLWGSISLHACFNALSAFLIFTS